MFAVEPGSRRQRFKSEMLAWRDIIGRGERPRSANRFVIVAAPEALRAAADERLFEQWTHIRRAARSGEDRIAALECVLRRPPAVGDDGDPALAHQHVTHALSMVDLVAGEARQAPAWGCNPHG